MEEKIMKLKPLTPSGVIELAYLEVILMPNGEIICKGETVGHLRKFGEFLRKVSV